MLVLVKPCETLDVRGNILLAGMLLQVGLWCAVNVCIGGLYSEQKVFDVCGISLRVLHTVDSFTRMRRVRAYP